MIRERIGMRSLPVVLLLGQICIIFVFSLFVALFTFFGRSSHCAYIRTVESQLTSGNVRMIDTN